MDVRHLKYFVAVAELKSFSLASKRLAIAQPPLSRQIKDLEAELKVVLLNRNKRSVQLTQVGRELLIEAKKILEKMENLASIADKNLNAISGEIRIGIMPAAANAKFATILQDFRKEHSGIRLTIQDSPSNQQIGSLLSGGLDVGFLRSGTSDKRLNRISIQRDRMGLAVPSSHRLSGKRTLNWSEINQEEFILLHPDAVSSSNYARFYEWCNKNQFQPKKAFFAGNLSTQLWLVSAGFGVAAVALPQDELNHHKIVLKNFPGKPLFYETEMVWRKSESSPLLRKFTDFITDRYLKSS